MFDIDMSGFVEGCFKIYNILLKNAYDLLLETPSTFKNGVVLAAMKDLNAIFITLGTALIPIFFLMGFIKESIDVKREIELVAIIKLFMRILFAEYLVTNVFALADSLFKIASALIKTIGGAEYTKLVLSDETRTALENCNIGEFFGVLILGVIVSLVLIVLGATIIYTIYMRFFKLYLGLPFGALAYSTVAGVGNISSSAATYTKTMIVYALEGVAIALALAISNASFAGGLGIDFGSDTAVVIVGLLEPVTIAALTVGIIKGAEGIVRKLV